MTNNNDIPDLIIGAVRTDRRRKDLSTLLDLDVSIIFAIKSSVDDMSLSELTETAGRVRKATEYLKAAIDTVHDSGSAQKEEARDRADKDKAELDEFFKEME